MTPPSTTTLTCADGGNFDLLNPQVEDVSFAVICEHLAKANRYCGATPGTAYSVAQHSVLCAKAAMVATGDRELAAYLLCHDMHEAYLGDDTTPKKRALAAIIGGFGVLASAVNDAFATLTDRIDTIIHARAGLAWRPSPDMKVAIHHWDRVLLATEWRDLMRFPKPYDFGALPFPDAVEPHAHWQAAAHEMHTLCATLLPGFSAREAD
jgi:hypothetical protein